MDRTTVVLGDAGTGNTDDTYTGEVSPSPVSFDYVRGKIREFQTVLNALDASYNAGLYTWNLDDQSDARLDDLLRDYESNSTQIKATAEALNMGADLVNAAGGRLPVLSIPQTLGLGPMAGIVVPAAVVTALAAVAGWVSYSVGYASAMSEAIDAVRAKLGDHPRAGEVVAQLEKARAAQVAITTPGISQIAGGVKLLSVAALAFMLWKVLSGVADRAAGDRVT